MVLLSTPSVLCSLRQVLVLNELNRLTPAPCPQGLWSVSALVGMLDHAHVMQRHIVFPGPPSSISELFCDRIVYIFRF